MITGGWMYEKSLHATNRRYDRKRKIQGQLGVAHCIPSTGLVPTGQVRYLYSLGLVFRARIQQRVVFAQHVYAGFEGIRASHRYVRSA